MIARLPLAFVCALALHGGAGLWLGGMLGQPEPVPLMEAASEIEIELTAPPESVPDTAAPEQPSEPELEPPRERPPEPDPTPELVEETPPPPAAEPQEPPAPPPPIARYRETTPPAPKPKSVPRPVVKTPAPPRAPGPVAPANTGRPSAPAPLSPAPAGPTSGPVCVSRSEPAYPDALLRRGIGGTVGVTVAVDVRGRVTDTIVSGSSGQPDLDRAAASGVRRWRFRPALQRGVPVPSSARVNVVFRPVK